MCSLRNLLYCALFLYAAINGQSHTIRIPLYKQAACKSVDAFRGNVDTYTEVLKFLYGSTFPGVPVGKIDINVDYRAGIEIGFPKKQRMVVNFETTFSGLWVPSSKCILSLSCYNKNSYDSRYSVEYIEDVLDNKIQSRTILYGIEKFPLINKAHDVKGNLGFETLWMDGIEVSGVHFMEATDMSSQPFNYVLSDGVFGLGFPSASLKMAPPFFTMLDRGVLDSPEFSLFVGRKTQSGELLFGGRNNFHFINESLRFHPLIGTDEWKLKVNSVNFSGNNLCSVYCNALIDTGTALIAAPVGSLKSIYSALNMVYNGHVATVDCLKLWSMPSLTIDIDGQLFCLNGYDYVIKIDDNSCVLGFMESPKEYFWILGNVFLSTVYTVFNAGEKQIGFATLSNNQLSLTEFSPQNMTTNNTY